MRIQVECYSGFKADERPMSFHLGERKLDVEEILDRWYGQEHDYFKLRADDGNTYILRHVRLEDQWEITMFSRPDTPSRPMAR